MIFIRKVGEEFGWLGNMSPFAVELDGVKYRTTEALFQCMRFEDEQIRSLIRAAKSPMMAKTIAKKHRKLMRIEPLSTKLQNMRDCLQLKLSQHPVLIEKLQATGDEWIVEDCTKRPGGSGLFWGAKNMNGDWKGDNWLGVLWMELRSTIEVVT